MNDSMIFRIFIDIILHRRSIMNFIFSEQERKEYNDFLENIPELQQKLLAASQIFLRPKNYHRNNAASTIQSWWKKKRKKY